MKKKNQNLRTKVHLRKKKKHNLVDFESSPFMFLNFSWVQPIYKFLSPKKHKHKKPS